MMNLFAVFDPSTSFFSLSLNWSSTLICLLILPLSYWIIPSRIFFIWTKVLLTLHSEFKILFGKGYFNGSTFLFVNLFSLIVFNNFLGLFPYIFTSSSHLTFTLTLSLPLWLSVMFYGWLNQTQHMFTHLVPQGTPSVLMPFMVCIETISNVIRPMTLAIRLTANMIAGHLLLTLLGNLGPSLPLTLMSFLIITQILLLVLEMAVSVIQSYVFAVLMTLYASEVN